MKSALELCQQLQKIIADKNIDLASKVVVNVLNKIESLETDLENMTNEKDIEYDRAENLQEQIEDLEKEIEDLEDKCLIFDKLETFSSSYQLSDSQYHQTEILRLLEEEFNLKLICIPARNQ